jgi:hypothetical protein
MSIYSEADAALTGRKIAAWGAGVTAAFAVAAGTLFYFAEKDRSVEFGEPYWAEVYDPEVGGMTRRLTSNNTVSYGQDGETKQTLGYVAAGVGAVSALVAAFGGLMAFANNHSLQTVQAIQRGRRRRSAAASEPQYSSLDQG